MEPAGLIYQAIPKMLADVDAIGKDKRNQQQGFVYRGIDDVYNAIHPILAKHKVFILTTVLDEKRSERETTKGGTLFYTRLTCRFDFCAEDGSKVCSTIVGEAMDSGDKATNKALSVAMKYALFQLLCIPTEAVDPDQETHEVKPRSQQQRPVQRQEPRRDAPPAAASDEAAFMDAIDRIQKADTADALQKLVLRIAASEKFTREDKQKLLEGAKSQCMTAPISQDTAAPECLQTIKNMLAA